MTPFIEKLLWVGIVIRLCTIPSLASARKVTPSPTPAPSLRSSGSPVVITMRESPTSTTAANATTVVCSICPIGQYVGDPTATLVDPFTEKNTTCYGIQMKALNQNYTAKQCSALLMEFNTTCGCTNLTGPTEAPTSPGSPAPSSSSPQTNTSAPATAKPSPKPTSKPTATPTAGPTMPLPTAFPTPVATTLSPTATLTSSPTTTPIETIGSATIVLSAFEALMNGTTIQTYQDSVALFYQENLSPFLSFEATLFSQEFVSSRRRLQSGNTSTLKSIQTVLNITAMSAVVVEDFNLVLQTTLNENATGLIDVLKGSEELDDALYFSSLDALVAIDPSSANNSPAPSPMDQETASQGSSGLGLGAIIGIALGGVGFLFIIVVVIICVRQDDDDDDLMPIASASNQYGGDSAMEPMSRQNGGAPVASSSSSPQRKSNNPSLESHFNTEEQDPNGRRQQQPLSTFSSESIPTVESDNLTFTTSGAQSALGTQSYLGTEYGGDAMSYAYSLDAGNMDQSVAGTMGPGGGGTVGGGASAGFVGTVGDDSASALSQRQLMVARDVMAPPGKLGIVIDTTLDGPVVHKVNPKSPLEGLLFPGDIIIAIDDVDTRAMSASAITALMVRTANQQRKLRVLSEDDGP